MLCDTVYSKKYAHGFCFAVLCCGYTLTDFPYPSGLLHWHCGNLTIAPVPARQPWWIWINTSCEFIMNDCITTTKQSTTKPCAYFLGYTVTTSIHWCWRPENSLQLSAPYQCWKKTENAHIHRYFLNRSQHIKGNIAHKVTRVHPNHQLVSWQTTHF